MVVGPLMAALPTPRQRALAALRDTAVGAGVRISFRKPPVLPPRMQRLSDLDLVCYSVALAPKNSRLLQRGLFVRSALGWESRDYDTPVPEVLADLPEDAEIVVIGWDEIAVFWSEQGDVKQVIAALKSLHPDPHLR